MTVAIIAHLFNDAFVRLTYVYPYGIGMKPKIV